jgi:hypothetical protein
VPALPSRTTFSDRGLAAFECLSQQAALDRHLLPHRLYEACLPVDPINPAWSVTSSGAARAGLQDRHGSSRQQDDSYRRAAAASWQCPEAC